MPGSPGITLIMFYISGPGIAPVGILKGRKYSFLTRYSDPIRTKQTGTLDQTVGNRENLNGRKKFLPRKHFQKPSYKILLDRKFQQDYHFL